jgi:hypothetical protein
MRVDILGTDKAAAIDERGWGYKITVEDLGQMYTFTMTLYSETDDSTRYRLAPAGQKVPTWVHANIKPMSDTIKRAYPHEHRKPG